ncbi:MAG TPA: membrane protein insertase YidC [Frankiaceae bacterium]|nr:membrane protein insertase YidC [Frankiaceae bacterium]
MMDLFRGLLTLIAQAIVKLHDLTGPVFGDDSGIAWGLAIVLLTVCVRLLMYPLFVKQIKTQRAMTALQPKIKELQAKHKGDKETLNTEMMKLYKEHNANPFAGCLPVLLQMPIFIALFQVLNQLAPKLKGEVYEYPAKFGLSEAQNMSFMKAKVFGAPIGAGFQSPARLLTELGGSSGAVKLVAITLIVAMALTTFFTSKQMMGKNPNADASQATQQKILLYVMPVLLGVFGFQVAIGVLIYWTTTNLFSMAQQTVVMKRLGPPEVTLAAGKAKAAAKKKNAAAAAKPAAPKTPAKTAPAGSSSVASSSDGAAAAKPAAQRPANRNKNRGKGQRRGGRR